MAYFKQAPMKVFDITTFYSTGRGGITTYLERKAQLSAAHGRVDHNLILGGPKDELGNFHGSRCYWVKSRPCGWNPHYRYLINYFKIKKILCEAQPDVIETSDPYWIPLYLLRLRRYLPKTRLFMFYRADFPDTYVVPFFQAHLPSLVKPARALCWRFLRAVLNRLNGVVVHSEIMGDKLRREGITAPIHAVGNLTNFEPFLDASANGEFIKTLKTRFGDVGPRLLYCGRLSFEKGLDSLLIAFKQFRLGQPKAVLVVVGDGPLRGKLGTLSADGHNHIHFIPATPDRTYLASIFAACNVMVMPGPYETFSQVTLESIVCGLPVVGVRGTGGIAALIKPGIGFLCESAQPDELCMNIARALQSKQQWYRQDVRQQIIASYRPERVYDNLLNAYGYREAGSAAAGPQDRAQAG